MKIRFLLSFILLFTYEVVSAQDSTGKMNEKVKPRIRVIIDNDFGDAPDGLFQLAHHLLSPSVEISVIIGSHHYEGGFYGYSGNVEYRCIQANELLNKMGLSSKYTVYKEGMRV